MKKIEFNDRRVTSKIFPKTLILIIILLVIKFDNYLSKTFFKVSKKNEKSKIKVCLCAIAKDENLYISDFLKYYKKLGYDHIYIYDNNDINDEKVENIIKKYINIGFVTLIDYRGYRGKKK